MGNQTNLGFDNFAAVGMLETTMQIEKHTCKVWYKSFLYRESFI